MTNTTARFGFETVTVLQINAVGHVGESLIRYCDDSTLWVRTERLTMTNFVRDEVLRRMARKAFKAPARRSAWDRNPYPGID